MTQFTLTLLGPPQIEADGRSIEIGRRKAVALLAYLAVTGQAHSRESLAALLWPEASQRRARAGLRSALWALNKTPVAAWLHVDGEMIALLPDEAVVIDAVRFRALLATAEAHDHPHTEICAGCLPAVTTAVSLYQADFMAGFTLSDAPAFDEWQFFEADDLRALLARAIEHLLRFHSEAGDWDQAIAYGRRLTALDPWHEPAQYALMELYARSGQQAAALRQYRLYRETMAAELGLGPSAEMTALQEQIRSGTWPQREAHQPPIVPPPAAGSPPPYVVHNVAHNVDHNLPVNPTPFIGREDELRRLATFLGDPGTRLLTIVGPGGIGKTRLALAAASALSPARFKDGVYFVSLTPVDEPEAMLSLIAETVGYPLQSDGRPPAQQLCDYLRRQSLLLILDNFEHLLAGTTFVAELLSQAPQVTVLATSRERLNLYEEQQLLLGGLAVPEAKTAVTGSDYPAAVLFLHCARRRRPDFELTAGDLPHLATICRLVAGIPLALELAAAWTEVLSLREIAAEIECNLDFLETDVRNVPVRHRSMRAVFDASWQRLRAAEQRVYAQLSVFRSGFTAAAAGAVTGASLKILASLVHQSLLRVNPDKERYDLHELLRQYAADKLREADAEEEAVRDRHAITFCAFLQARGVDLKGVRQRAALDEIEAESENASAAWRWAVTRQQLDWLAQALVPLALFYQWNGRVQEGEAMCRLAVERLTQVPVAGDEASRNHLLLKLLTWQSLFNLASARYEDARHALQQAQAVLDDPTLHHRDTAADQAFLFLQLSEAAKIQAFDGDALALNEQSLALYRAIDDAWGVTLALDALTARYQSLGNYHQALKLQEECLIIHQRSGNRRGIARAYAMLGHNLIFAGQIEQSERYLRQSLALLRDAGTRADQRNPLLLLGINLLFGGKFQASIDAFEACWAIHRDLGMPHEPASANVGIARAKIDLGRYDEARRLSETDLIRYRSLNHKWYIAFTLFNLGRIALVEGDAAQAQDHFQESVSLLLEMGDRPLLPDVLLCQAFVQRQLGRRQQAMQVIRQGLTIAMEGTLLKPMRFELPAMAILCLDAGEKERAIELYAAARQSPYIANSRWFEAIVGQEIAQATAALPPTVVAAAEARGWARDLRQAAADLLAELGGEVGS
jgi:predicted ATPase/DNA-binding SARP family transcriptional activator